MKKVFMFVNVDWFFFSHRMPIAKKAQENNVQMRVYTEFTFKEKHPDIKNFSLFQSPLSRSTKNYGLFLIEFIKLYLLIRKNRPDLIHAVTIKPIIFLGIVSRLTGIPFIGAVTGLGPVFNRKTIFSRIRLMLVMNIYRFIFRSKSSVIICQNRHDKEILDNYRVASESEKLIIPGSGVNLEKFKPGGFKKQIPIVLMASRILKEKGVYEFCSAAKSFHKEDNKKVKFMLAGPIDSSSPSSISSKALKSLCHDSGVDYLGDIKDLNLLLAKVSIFVLPSYYSEGLPKVLLEAAASGCPIVTTDHPGCRDAIVNNKTGILVEIRNPKVLQSAISNLLAEPNKLTSMGKASRNLAEELFDEKKVIEAHYALYEKYANKPS